jgi:hypothetical protein
MRRITYRGASLAVTHTRTGYYAEEYVVMLDGGEWPIDGDLVSLLYDQSKYKGDDIIPRRAPFGGAVIPYLNGSKMVTVYQD